MYFIYFSILLLLFCVFDSFKLPQWGIIGGAGGIVVFIAIVYCKLCRTLSYKMNVNCSRISIK